MSVKQIKGVHLNAKSGKLWHRQDIRISGIPALPLMINPLLHSFYNLITLHMPLIINNNTEKINSGMPIS